MAMLREIRLLLATLFLIGGLPAGVQAATHVGVRSGDGNEVTEPAALPLYFSVAGCSRKTGTRWDPILQQNWVTTRSCDHPERPMFAHRTSEEKKDSMPTEEEMRRATVPVVHAGDTVRLWKLEDHLRIEVVAICEESGVLGSRVRVRPARASFGELQERQLTGVVRGPADVEMR
jgi:hypothetical protein